MFNNVTIPLGRSAIYGEMFVNTNDFSPDVQKHIYIYGLRQILNDAIAQKKDADDNWLSKSEIVAKAQKRLDNLLAGVLRQNSQNEILDGKSQTVQNLLREQLLTKWRNDGNFANFPKGTKNRFLFHGNKLRAASGKSVFETDQEFLATVLAENPRTKVRLEKRAEEILAERNEDLGIEI